MKTQEVHKIYGPGATRTIDGREITADIRTAVPTSKVTCKVCLRIEAKRRAIIEARSKAVKS